MTICTAALPLEPPQHTGSCAQKAHIIDNFDFEISKFTYYEAYRLLNYNPL